jgi:hypothetical protein
MRAAACLDGENTLSRKGTILYEELLVFASENIIGYGSYSRVVVTGSRGPSAGIAKNPYQYCTEFEGGDKGRESGPSFQSRQG